jgi:hypothetical protein
MPEITPFAQRKIDLYRGWDELERRQAKQKDQDVYVIDLDLAPRVGIPTEFHNLKEVRPAIQNLLKTLPADEKNRDIIEAQLLASDMYLRAKAGEEFDLKLYVETLMGVTPLPIPEAEIEQAVLEAERLRQQAGPQDEIKDKKTRQQKYHQAMVFGRTALTNLVTINYGEIIPEYVDTDEPFIALVSTDPNGKVYIKINLRHPQIESEIYQTSIHEDEGHVSHVSFLKGEVESGNLNPAAAITTAHTPECTQLETVAQLMPSLLLSGQSPQYDAEIQKHRTRMMVYHNAHIAINLDRSKDKTKLDRVKLYVKERIPNEPLERIEGSIIARRDDPALRAYLGCYWPALDLGDRVLKLGKEQQKQKLNQLYPLRTISKLTKLILDS